MDMSEKVQDMKFFVKACVILRVYNNEIILIEILNRN